MSVARAGATCRVGSGDGIGARRRDEGTAFLGWVARAGVDVRARRTGVRLRALFAVTRTFFLAAVFAFGDLEAAFFTADFLAAGFFETGFLAVVLLACGLPALPFTVRFATTSVTRARADLFATFLRVVERTAPVVLLRDVAAFNCFPLFGLWPRP